MNTLLQSKFSKFSLAGMVSMAIILGAGAAMAGIGGSKHDLGSSGGGQGAATSTTGEVCVFCHTPHGSDTSASVPLWNRKLTNNISQTYADLGTITLDGGETAIGSVTLACLTCHDGVQAMDVVLNKPGSGGYNSAGSGIDGGTRLMTGDPSSPTSGRIPMLGSDLRNDHPVSIQYAGGGYYYETSTFSGAMVDSDFVAPTTKVINSQPVWFIDGDTDTNLDKNEIRMYTRTPADVATNNNKAQPFVECASCHDPHVTANGPFLRKANTGSAVCLACHNK